MGDEQAFWVLAVPGKDAYAGLTQDQIQELRRDMNNDFNDLCLGGMSMSVVGPVTIKDGEKTRVLRRGESHFYIDSWKEKDSDISYRLVDISSIIYSFLQEGVPIGEAMHFFVKHASLDIREDLREYYQGHGWRVKTDVLPDLDPRRPSTIDVEQILVPALEEIAKQA